MAKELDQLTMDSIAAQKAGMSYGKWKALHPHTHIPKAKPERPCKNCGEEIPSKFHKNVGFCCDLCRREAAKARDRNRKRKG